MERQPTPLQAALRTVQVAAVARRTVQAVAPHRRVAREAQHTVAVGQEALQHIAQQRLRTHQAVAEAPHTEVAQHTEEREKRFDKCLQI